MRLSLKSLASGSSGNCYLLEGGETTVLIDCGLAARAVCRELRGRGIDPASLAAILLTHEHIDHLLGIGPLSRRYGVPVVANPATLDAAARVCGRIRRWPLATGETLTVGELEVTSFPVPHDAVEPVGYLVGHAGWRVCVLTDVGSPSAHLDEPLRAADLLVVEANHDCEWLTNGPYPLSLKSRILAPTGHLANSEAALLLARSERSAPRWVWLAHLSAVNNNPKLARRTVGSFLRREGMRGIQLDIALRDKPSVYWSLEEVGWQLPMPLWPAIVEETLTHDLKA